jgi:hypothetical protein
MDMLGLVLHFSSPVVASHASSSKQPRILRYLKTTPKVPILALVRSVLVLRALHRTANGGATRLRHE